MKKRVLLLLPACLATGIGIYFVRTENTRIAMAEFEALTDTMFKNEIVSSTLNLHYTLQDPESYGITKYPITYGNSEDVSLVLSAAEPAASDYLQILLGISESDLSQADSITYDILFLALENEVDAKRFSLYAEPLGPTIGIQAQLPVLLAEYAFTDKTDIEDYLTLIAQTDSYFSSLLQFEKAKAAAGLFMSDQNADAIISQCESFYKTNITDNPLITVFNEKTEALDFLDAEEKAIYQERNLQAITTHVLPAYELLTEGLSSLKGSGKNENGLSYYPQGKAYYEYLLRSSVGTYLSADAVERRIRAQLAADLNAAGELLDKYPDASADAAALELPTEPAEILSELWQKMSADYPACEDADVSIKYVDESLEDFLSPAFYLTPPLDNADENTIYINNASVTTDLELYTTLAHEGYPGHLYQTLASKDSLDPVRSLFSFGGYTEGWATYVEMASFSYTADTETEAAAAEYARLERSVMLGIYSLLDVSIHYRGYTREDTAAFLQKLGFTSPDGADAIFDAILEAPANYLKYYLGYLTFADLRDYCEENWPEKFDLKDFHRQVLRIGPAPFPVVEKYLKLYYTQ